MRFWAHYDRPLQEQQEPLALVCGIEIWLLVSICCIFSGLSELKMMSQTDSIEMLLELELVQDVEDSSNRQNVKFAQDNNKIIQFSYR
ncbi:hypothetical protein G6F56_013123 [Rhizopus delemar]|nr:hypothetical protein G6F56_013123 [Rhizopus delemar]